MRGKRLFASIGAFVVATSAVVGFLVYRHIPKVHVSAVPESEQESLRNLVRGFEAMAEAHSAGVAAKGSASSGHPRSAPAAAAVPAAAEVDWEQVGDKMTRELASQADLSVEEQSRVRHVLITVGRARALLEHNEDLQRRAEQEASLVRVAETQLRFVVPHDKEDAVTAYFRKQPSGVVR
jgi:hypothetical protein